MGIQKSNETLEAAKILANGVCDGRTSSVDKLVEEMSDDDMKEFLGDFITGKSEEDLLKSLSKFMKNETKGEK